MNVEWLYTSVRGIGAICVVIAIAECAVEGDDGGKGMRLICGAAVAAAAVRMAAALLVG